MIYFYRFNNLEFSNFLKEMWKVSLEDYALKIVTFKDNYNIYNLMLYVIDPTNDYLVKSVMNQFDFVDLNGQNWFRSIGDGRSQSFSNINLPRGFETTKIDVFYNTTDFMSAIKI